jgi:hypothetical protein
LALRSSTMAKDWPSGGRRGSSPWAAISATCSLLGDAVKGLPLMAVVPPTRNWLAAGHVAPGRHRKG